MAAPPNPTAQYSSENFVESAGAIIFHRATRQICLVHYLEKDEWLLAKGRRNVGEASPQTAIRESQEETGFKCRLLPVTMSTRAPPAVELPNYMYPNKPRVHDQVCEPFMITCRQIDHGRALKFIKWYIAETDELIPTAKGEAQFEAALFGFEQSVQKLTYEPDREVVRQAMKIYEANFGSK